MNSEPGVNSQKFAQTNIALYNQMIEKGYSEDNILLVKRAYEFAAKRRMLYLRASGKPFICHLVGTASVLVELGRSPEAVAAGLLHAMYLKGSDFGVGVGLDQRRDVLRREFGEVIENLVHQYHKFKWKYSYGQVSEVIDSEELDPDTKEILVIKMANEVDDFLDNAVAYMGNNSSATVKKKDVGWRLEYMRSTKQEMSTAATKMGLPDLSSWIEQLVDSNLETNVYPSMRSGKVKTYKVKPPSVIDTRKSRKAKPKKSIYRRLYDKVFKT